HVVGGAAASFLECPVLGLLVCVEGRAGRHFRQFLQLLIGLNGIAFASDLFGSLGCSRIEELQSRFRVDSDGRMHFNSFLCAPFSEGRAFSEAAPRPAPLYLTLSEKMVSATRSA